MWSVGDALSASFLYVESSQVLAARHCLSKGSNHNQFYH